jgi:hypothetical protein
LPPNLATDTVAKLPADFALPPCVGWDLQRFSSFAGAVGAFRSSGMNELLSRLGAISSFKGMRYWSVTDGRLEPLVTDAFAVEGAGFKDRRSDFTATEMQVGQDFHFVEHDNRSSGVVLYRMRIVERSPGQVVVDISNASKVGLFLLTLFEPGDLRTTLFFSDNADGTWTCYAFLALHPTTFAGLLDNHKSHVNRLIALYGHVTGSDDRELPWVK